MANIDIAQAEADALIAMEKQAKDQEEYTFPAEGQKLPFHSSPLIEESTLLGCNAISDKAH